MLKEERLKNALQIERHLFSDNHEIHAITFDTGGPRQSRRAVSAPHSSLINRIQNPPFADRLSSDDIQVKDSASPSPTRTRPSRRGGRGMPRGGAATQRSDPRPKVLKTAEDLDKELETLPRL
ncbi:hypothetical protein EV368DRAFT_86569 [Lentinula lateritia]|nr:hypothetical protein EV368DRAFT_86569 [Lentinula lateritia]